MPEATLSTIPQTPCRRKPRKELRPDETLCDYCGAKCCLYFALPVDKPKEWQDFDYIRWYLLHEQAAVFVEEDCWYLLVQNRCKHLRDDNLCGIYETRPQICRDYTAADCEYDDDWTYDHYWESPEQVEQYAEAVLGPREGGTHRSAKPQAASSTLTSNLRSQIPSSP